MKVLTPGLDLEAFFSRVHRAGRRLLMLDYDGTLAPFRTEREQARPYTGVPVTLDALMAAGSTRVVLISGRKAAEVVHLAGLRLAPEVWGTHGWERLAPDGSYQRWELPAKAGRGLAEARASLAGEFPERLEEKPASLAFHLRGLADPRRDEVQSRVAECWGRLAGEAGLEVHRFDGGLELRAPGRSKATAVEQLLEEEGPSVVSAYLGDDFTDEDAFTTLRERGLGVLVRPELRPTAASLWLVPPRELLEFFNLWTAACHRN